MPTVRFFREGVDQEASPNDTLLDTARRAGVQLYRSFHVLLNCKGQGKCGSCRVEISEPDRVVPGERTEPEHRHLDRRFSDPTTRLACQVRPCSDVSVLTQPTGNRTVETRSFIPRGF